MFGAIYIHRYVHKLEWSVYIVFFSWPFFIDMLLYRLVSDQGALYSSSAYHPRNPPPPRSPSPTSAPHRPLLCPSLKLEHLSRTKHRQNVFHRDSFETVAPVNHNILTQIAKITRGHIVHRMKHGATRWTRGVLKVTVDILCSLVL